MDGVVETINMASLCKTLIAEFTDIANQMLKTISDLLPVAMGVGGAKLKSQAIIIWTYLTKHLPIRILKSEFRTKLTASL